MTDDAPAPPAQIPAEFLVNRQGSTFITYRGLIHLAHEQGLSATSTQLVQAPDAANGMTAIVTAQVTTEKGTFAGMGDANPGNVPKMIQPHLLRMAETRALARALRVATDAAYTALEELGDDAPSPPTAAAPQIARSTTSGQEADFSKSAPPPAVDTIEVGGQRYTRAHVWAAYQQRRAAALAAQAVAPGDELLALESDAHLTRLVGASQRLKGLMAMAPTPVPDGAPPPEVPEEAAP